MLLISCLTISCAIGDSVTQKKEKPNIVFLFADDMTYSAINALDNSEIETPNLDKLVNGGVSFTNAFNMGAWGGAVCETSRAMIILGGVEKPDYVEFKSFLPQAKGETTKGNYDEIYGAYIDHQRIIRKDGYKLITYPRVKKLLLFDLQKGPNEINNLAEDAGQEENVKSMFADLIDLQKELDDKLDLQELYNEVI